MQDLAYFAVDNSSNYAALLKQHGRHFTDSILKCINRSVIDILLIGFSRDPVNH